MGLFKKILGVPENSSISEEFNKVFSPEVHPDYKESYEVADKNLQEKNERNKIISTPYYNCSNLGCKYTPDRMCSKCNGTGHI